MGKTSSLSSKRIAGKARKVKGVSSKSKRAFKKHNAAKSTSKKTGTVTPAVKKPSRGKTQASSSMNEDKKDRAKKRKAPSAAMATRKERRLIRKQHSSSFELVSESKVIWEHLRPHKPSPSKALALEEIMALASGHFKELSLKHDTARVVQSCLKNGSAEHRTAVFTELKEAMVELSKTKYSKFVVKAMLKYCSASERAELIGSLYGHVRRLIRHAEAGEVVETAFNEFANGRQRTELVQEFYGTEFALFKTPQADSPAPLQSLEDVLAASPEHSKRIMGHMKDSLLPLLQKDVFRHSIVHRALLDYLLHCTTEARAEMIEGVRERLVHILHTKDGSRVALQCIWHGTVKDRKIIVKSLKGLVCKVCREENGHIVMMGLFESVDDTVFLKKVLITEMVQGLSELSRDHYGRRVLLHLLCPRCPRHFSPQFVGLLSPGDGNAHTKKPSNVRYKELLQGVGPPLLSLATANPVEWACTPLQAPLLLEMAILFPDDLLPLYEPLLKALSEDQVSEGQEGEDQEGVGLVQHPCGHWVIKKLISIDSEREQPASGKGFAAELLERVSGEQLCNWVSRCNRGGFVVSALLGVGGEVGEKVAAMLTPIRKTLAKSAIKGHQAVHNALEKFTNT